ncbi:hypothetical protein HK100_010518 [Physocladia obscura]|uniref:Uncharacterized protein n=1 Tax=Physocladia obscura TaxID=109957 RepID=A0AAD5XHI2_9FUNG|nr:hypothetical protein HK100_010518 [Physocladia obscura]
MSDDIQSAFQESLRNFNNNKAQSNSSGSGIGGFFGGSGSGSGFGFGTGTGSGTRAGTATASLDSLLGGVRSAAQNVSSSLGIASSAEPAEPELFLRPSLSRLSLLAPVCIQFPLVLQVLLVTSNSPGNM